MCCDSSYLDVFLMQVCPGRSLVGWAMGRTGPTTSLTSLQHTWWTGSLVLSSSTIWTLIMSGWVLVYFESHCLVQLHFISSQDFHSLNMQFESCILNSVQTSCSHVRTSSFRNLFVNSYEAMRAKFRRIIVSSWLSLWFLSVVILMWIVYSFITSCLQLTFISSLQIWNERTFDSKYIKVFLYSYSHLHVWLHRL